ncbi:nucleotide sugar dehydrogenase [Bacteriovoracales bacterium]|nr:nucleotide sugar dehydrogenase [Bacteriovoracales bacterium]
MHERDIAVVGLGYVGLPVAISFAQKMPVVGFDIDKKRVNDLIQGFDHTGEIQKEDLKNSKITFTSDPLDLKNSRFFIVAVPTPIDSAKRPDLSLLKAASETVAHALKKGDVVVFESTVYPGATEEHCIPVLEEVSGLKLGEFKVGYSPERINPGDKEHTFSKITKVVSGSDSEALEIISQVYSSVVDAGIYKASSIKIAEAAKVIENTQRDLNISLMNELSIIFDKMGISTSQVIDAASTKWNFLPFKPGLVGGHCIGVDPYYLTYQAERLGHIPQVILSGRKINDSMGKYLAEKTVKEMVKAGIHVSQSKVAILGATFKENCSDIRNSKVFDIYEELKTFGVDVIIHDPLANQTEVLKKYGIKLSPWQDIKKVDALVLAVPHKQYKELDNLAFDQLCNNKAVLIDVKSMSTPPYKFKNIKRIWSL